MQQDERACNELKESLIALIRPSLQGYADGQTDGGQEARAALRIIDSFTGTNNPVMSAQEDFRRKKGEDNSNGSYDEQPDDCADIFQKDYAKYVKEWSDDTMSITAQERDAYAAGWQDAWRHKRESIGRDFMKEAQDTLINVRQLLSGWHQDGTAWSEWDRSVEAAVGSLQIKIEEYLNGK